MKTMILAAAAVLTLSVGAAAAGEGEGGPTAGELAWRAQNGNPEVPATTYFARAHQASQQQFAANQNFTTSSGSGQG